MAQSENPLSKRLASQVGKRTGKGTLITEGLVSRIAADEGVIIEIQNDNSEAIANAINEALVTALNECGIDGERFAKDNLTKNRSVDTGRLRNSVTHQIREQEKAVYIGTNVEYAPYVELGTERAKANPYLKPAAEEHSEHYRKIFEKHMKNA